MKTQIMAGLVLLTAILVACTNSNQKEVDAMAKAQQCLDQVSDSDPTTATNCLTYTTPYNSQRAYLMRCSIYLTAGGLVTSRMLSAYNTSQDPSVSSSEKQAVYVGLLAFAYPNNVANAYTAALNAQSVCAQTGDAGFIFVSNMSVIGSLANSVWGSLNSSTTGIDFTNLSPSAISTDIQQAVSYCTSNPSSATCDPTNIAAAATAAATVATSYCAGNNSSSIQGFCNSVDQINSWGTTNTTTITNGIMCELQGKTFTPPSTCT